MTYEERYAAMESELLVIATEIARRFDATPEAFIGDDCGYEFLVDRPDGEAAHVRLLMEDGADNGARDAGNLTLRADADTEHLASVIPDNRTGLVFADYSDGEAWGRQARLYTEKHDRFRRQDIQLARLRRARHPPVVD